MIHKTRFTAPLLLCAAMTSFAACVRRGETGPEVGVTEAVAAIQPTRGNTARGVVRFTQLDGKVKIEAELEGLSPGLHGFHVHEFGDLSAGDGSSCGGHYNPEGHPHAGPDDPKRHAGDLGNLVADSEGRARLKLIADNISVSGIPNPVIGRAVIVHEKADDLTTQPTGAAGARVGHGVIGAAGPRE